MVSPSLGGESMLDGQSPARTFHRLVAIAFAALLLLSAAACDQPPAETADGGPAAPFDDDDDWKTPDGEDLRGAAREEDENEETVVSESDLVSNPSGNPGLTTIGTSSRIRIRTATFNAHLLDAKRVPNVVPKVVADTMKVPATTALGRLPFELARTAKIHVLGVQEVMRNSRGKLPDAPAKWDLEEDKSRHPLLTGATDGKYAIVVGDPVQVYRFTYPQGGDTVVIEREEYCPIIFHVDELDCREAGATPLEPAPTPGLLARRQERRAHKAACTVKRSAANPKPTFFFCAHFAANAGQNTTNVTRLGMLLAEAPNVIVGADFNSNPNQGNPTATVDAYRMALGLDPPANRKYVAPMGAFSEIHERGMEIRIRADGRKTLLDDIVWSQPLDANAPTPPTFLRKFVLGWNKRIEPAQAWFQAYHQVSDHIPVIADFEF